ncbi:MAG: NAD(P)H-hydrate epimerase [Pirellulales bacterium]|nr:NAD(P)H-hydrate epimerase [Pirellulales bacterium]
MQSLTKDQCRQIDHRAVQEYGIASILLMENAGRSVADVLCGLFADSATGSDLLDKERMPVPDRESRQRSSRLESAGPVVLLCGKGNNAGDGFVIARHLEIRGVAIRVLLLADPEELRGDARSNYEILTKTDVPIFVPDTLGGAGGELRDWLDQHGNGAAWIVDALLGTGATGPPRPPLDTAIAWINDQPAKVLAVDVPSGLDCDTGNVSGDCVRAEVTCTFIAMKRGFLTPAANPVTGSIYVLDIGAPRKLVEEVSRKSSIMTE